MLRNLVITIGSKGGSGSSGMDFDFFESDELENQRTRKTLVKIFLL
jgi:hypothetical protein